MTPTSRVHWWITLVLLTVCGLMVVVGFGPTTGLPMLPRLPADRDVLRVAFQGALLPDPLARGFPMAQYNQLVLSLWEPLVECDPATGELQPAAAESWSWSADRKVLTLKLRPAGRWSNGDPVTASDFVRGWLRLLRGPEETAQTLFSLRNADRYAHGQLTDAGKIGLQAVDDLTLRLELDQVRSTLVAELADPLLSPLHRGSETILADRLYLTNPSLLVTNGPFQLELADAEGIRLKACRQYHGSQGVRLAGLHFVRIDRSSLAPLLVAAGVVDLVAPVGYGASGPLPTTRPVRRESELMLGVTSLDFNVTRGPLRDVRVRRALALALDRRGAIQRGNESQMVPAWSWIPSIPGRPGLTLLHENAAEARRLLAAAGYPGGRGFPVLEMALSMSNRGDPFPAYWTECWFRNLGVRTHLFYEPPAALTRRLMRTGDYDVNYGGIVATVPDAGDLLSGFLWPVQYSTSKWVSPEMRSALADANTKTGDGRLATLAKAERLLVTAMPVVPVLFDRREALMAAEVRGWYADPLARQSLKRLWLDPAPPGPAAKAELRM